MSFYEAFWDCEYQPTVCFVDEMIKLKERPKQFQGKSHHLKTDYYGKLQEYRCYQYNYEDDIQLYKISADSGITIKFEEYMLEPHNKKYLKSFIDTILKSDFNNDGKDSVNIEYKISTYDLLLTIDNVNKNGSIITHRKFLTCLSENFLNTTEELIQFLNKLDKQNKETK